MKYIGTFIFIFSFFAVTAYGAATPASTSETDKIFNEIDQAGDYVSEKTPEGVKNFFRTTFDKIEAWRIAKGNEFTAKRDQVTTDAGLSDETPNDIYLNAEGNIELETGIGKAFKDPQNYFYLYSYIALTFIFLNIFIFYGLAILVLLFVLKTVFRMFTRTT